MMLPAMKGAAEKAIESTLEAIRCRAAMEPPFRNGIGDRSREIKVSRWVFGIAGFYCISMFLVPFMMPTDTVPELSGRANMFDYANEESWGNQDHYEGGEMGPVSYTHLTLPTKA